MATDASVTEVCAAMERLSGTQFIDGAVIAGTGERQPVIDPATGRACGYFAEASAEEIDRAVAASGVAQRRWWALSALERAEALHEVANRLEGGGVPHP